MLILIICTGLFTAYSLLVLYYWYNWRAVPLTDVDTGTGLTNISVIIPARDEEKNIGQLLAALKSQTYPAELYEVIVVDDQSTDKTAEVVKSFAGVKLISLKEEGINSYKKKAIEKGIAAASGELIVTTDADCVPGPDWLKMIAG